MSNIFVFCLLMSVFLTGNLFAQDGRNSYTLTCRLSGFEEGTEFYLLNLDNAQQETAARLKNQTLIFKGRIREPTAYRLYYKDQEGRISDLNFWLEDKKIFLTATKNSFSSATIKGSPINLINQAVIDRYRNLENERNELMTRWVSETDEKKKEVLIMRVGEIDKKVLAVRLETIGTFKPSLVTIKELFFLRNDLSNDNLKKLFDRFPESLKQTKYGSVINQYLAASDIKVGAQASDIGAIDLNHKSVKLSDFKGKVVLLDFWASWCGPCRQSNKKLAEIYRKYQPAGFEILSFSTDTDQEEWRNASKADGIVWANISDGKGFYSEQAAAYKIRSLPKAFLIDKSGRIALVFNGYNQKSEKLLEAKIEELTR